MMVTALCVGLLATFALRRACGSFRRIDADVATNALFTLGAVGMFALATASTLAGAYLAAVTGAVVAVVLCVDLRRVANGLAHRAHASTVTPFQNAT